MEEEIEIGRLIRTLKMSCSDCGAKGLQLRSKDDLHYIDGQEVIQKHPYHYCNRCDYLVKVKDEKFNRKREWSPIVPPEEPEPVRKWDKNRKGNSDSKFDKDKPKLSKKG